MHSSSPPDEVRTTTSPPSSASHSARVNDLTARWCAAAGSDDFVVSGASVWPLLALLAHAATGDARAELAHAIGLPAEAAHRAALDVLDLIAGSRDMSAALGFWVRDDVPIRPEWSHSVPPGTVGTLTDQGALDAWARTHTRDMIDRFPLPITDRTLFVLATALAAKTTWRTPFRDTTLTPHDGPWAGRRLSGLVRTVPDLHDVAVLPGPSPVTRVVVGGTADIDVHLLLGDDSPGAALGTGLAALTTDTGTLTGLDVPPAPGLSRREVDGPVPHDTLHVELPPFTVRTRHDLLDHRDLFGLRAATETDRGHFPGLSPYPLAVGEGAQEVLAVFDREGFRAAAISAVMMAPGSARPATPVRRRTTELWVRFDRPFGFLLVHRDTGSAVVAGWIADPADGAPADAGPRPIPVPE